MTDFSLPSVATAALDVVRPLPQALHAAAGTELKRIEKTAKDFEASFLTVMLNQMFEGVTTSAPFGGGQGETAFRSFLNEAFADAMVKAGGVGVSDQIARELLKLQGATGDA